FEMLPRIWCEMSGRYRRPWSAYKQRRPTKAELRAWYRVPGHADEYGIAVIAGAVSGGLEIIDIDNWQNVEPWVALVEDRSPGLFGRLVRVRSPRPGLHVYYRCEEFGASQKLARIPLKDPDTGRLKAKVVIEVKGQAGYCLAPPSPGHCHPSGRPYRYVSDNDLSQVPRISPEERQVLLDCARHFDEWREARRKLRRKRSSGRLVGTRPGDEFNAKV